MRRKCDVMKLTTILAALAAVVPVVAAAQAAGGATIAAAPPNAVAAQPSPAPQPLPLAATGSTGQRLFAAGGGVVFSAGGSIFASPVYVRGGDPLDHLLDIPRGLGGDQPGALVASGDGKFNAPYYAMVRDAQQAGLSVTLGDKRRLRLGVLYEGALGGDVLPTMTPYARRALVSAELEQRVGRVVGVLSLGMLRESGSVLGSVQGGPLALDAAARTSFASFSLGYALAPQLSLVGMASAGHTSGFRNADSPATQLASVGTVAYSVGLAGRQLFNSSDHFGLTLTVPTKVTDGALSLAGAQVQHEDGALSYVNRTLNLAPSATERDLEMTYSRPLDRVAKLSAALMLRVNPGHDAASPRALLLGVRYGCTF